MDKMGTEASPLYFEAWAVTVLKYENVLVFYGRQVRDLEKR